MTQPSFSCPRCGYETFLPSDIRARYCPSCRWWTGDSLLGSEDVLAQAEIDGPFATTSIAHYGTPLRDANGTAYGWSNMVSEAIGDGSGEALPELSYCAEHDLYDCWYGHRELTRAEVEADWFGPPVGGAPGYAQVASDAFDHCDLEADLAGSLRDPAFRASYAAAEARSDAARRGAPLTWNPPPELTFRVARFVQALRSLRR